MKKRALLEERRRTIAADTAAFRRNGGLIDVLAPHVRRSVRGDQNNSYLFRSTPGARSGSST